MLLARKIHVWKRKIATALTAALVLGSFTGIGAPQKAAADPVPPAPANVIASYNFNGNTQDSLNGSTWAEVSGTVGGKSYGNATKGFNTDANGRPYWYWTRGANDAGGFTVDVNRDISTNYTIGVRFSYDSFAGAYTKILDFKDKVKDDGFYFDGNKLLFYSDLQQSPTGTSGFNVNDMIDLVVTREAASNTFTAYIGRDGVLTKEFSFVDTTGATTLKLSGTTSRIGFFFDDILSAWNTSGGKAYAVKIWDGPITEEQARGAMTAPGGVNQGLHLWLQADRGVEATGGAVSTWHDMSNSRDFTQGTNANRPAYNSDSKRLNFNPGVTFDGVNDYLSNAAGLLGSGTYNDFNVFVVSGVDSVKNTSLFYENTDNTGSDPRLQVHMPWSDGNIYWDAGSIYANRVSTSGGSAQSGKYYIWNMNFGIGSTPGQSIYRDGKETVSAGSRTEPMKGINKKTTLGSGQQGGISTNFYNGQVGEIIVYSASLTATERQKIQSYLAIKYGVSLDNVTYLDSNGGAIWNADADYNNNIAGIARDDGQGLYQKQSRSTNDASKLTIGIGPLKDKNEDVTGTLADKQSMIWGDNGQTLTTFRSPVKIANTYWKPSERVWKVQNTHGVGPVQLSIAKSAFAAGTQASNIKLLVDSDASFANAAAIGLRASGDSFVADNVNLPSGYYFTFAAANAAPGGVSNGLTSWVNVGKSALVNSDGKVVSLQDLADSNRSWSNGGEMPYVAAAINSNAGIQAPGNSYYRGTSFGNTDQLREVFSVQTSKITDGGKGFPWDFGGNPALQTSTYGNKDGKGNIATRFGSDVLRSVEAPGLDLTKPRLLDVFAANQDWALSVDGQQLLDATTTSVNFDPPTANTYYIGAGHFSIYKGDISEIVVYDRGLNPTEKKKVNSYLALKYGLTLNNGLTDYIASDYDSNETKMWSAVKNAGFGKRITGIGKDAASGLEQKQSKSQENGALVTIAAGNDIKASNEAYPDNTITNDRSFLTFSDNDGDTAYSVPVGTNMSRMARTFKVDKTNWLGGNVTLQLDGVQADKPTYIVIGADSGFTGTLKAAQLVNGKITLNSSDMADGSYFAFAQTIDNSKAPGGVSGASLWLKPSGASDNGSGLLAGWTDETGNNTFTVNGTPDYKPGNANFNSAVTFANTASNTAAPNEYLRGNNPIAYQSGYIVMKQQAGTAVGSSAPTGNYGAAIFSQWAGKLWAGNGKTSTYHGFAFNDPTRYSLAGLNSSNSAAPTGRLNGANKPMQLNGAFNQIAFTPVIGGTFGGGSLDNWDHYKGDIAEIVLFPTSKSAAEQQKVESYLGLKYGLTLNTGKPENNGLTDYMSSNGITKMWTAAANAGYGKRITGIGRDDMSDLMQKQSKSQEQGALVTIALGNAVRASNAENGNTIGNNLSFLTLSDNGASAAFSQTVTESTYYGYNMNLMERVHKVEKTNWQDGPVTLKLDGVDAANKEQIYLLLNADGNFATPRKIDFYNLNADGTVTIDSSLLASGSYFTFAKTHKNVLQAKVDLAGKLDESKYTPATWAVLKTARDQAIAVLANRSATQYEIDNALAALAQALDALEAMGGTQNVLKVEIDRLAHYPAPVIGSVYEPYYSAHSWSLLTSTYSVAKAVYADPSSTPAQYGNTLSKLNLAEVGLVDLRPLIKAKDDALALLQVNNATSAPGPYTSASWQALQNELADALHVLLVKAKDPNVEVTQAEVEAATKAVNDAVIGLKKLSDISDKTLLRQAITSIDDAHLIVGHYTADSWEALQRKLASARFVLDDPNATQAEVDEARAKLITARNSLVTVSDNSGETGGTGSGNGATGPSTPTATKEIITVDVVIGGDKKIDITKVEIVRTTHPDGRITDQVTLTPAKAQEAADKAVKSGETIARIVIPDPTDKVSETNVDIPADALAILQKNNIDLEIYTDNGVIHVPHASLEGLKEKIYFRLVPVKDPNERVEVEERARTEEIVRKYAGDNKIEVVTRPMTIETNLSSRKVTLTLPLRGVKLPENLQERQDFLNELAIFIEHDDGEKEVVRGEVDSLSADTYGLRFTIDKFSTFTIIRLASAGEKPNVFHIHYINGYPDGLIRPEGSATRAELATMLTNLGVARNVTFTGGFPDVDDSHWAAKSIQLLKSAGVMSGYPDGEFKPGNTITRAEMATIVFNYLKLSSTKHASFSDVAADHWASQMISAVQGAGIMSGYPDGTFQPDQTLTRAEAVTILNRVFHRGPLYGVPGPSWPDLAESHWAYRDIEEASRDHNYTVRQEGGETLVSR